MTEKGGRQYRLYVIELADSAGCRLRPHLPCVYVGQTADTPEERFAEHKRGHKASRVVRKYGLHLRPDLYGHIPAVSSRAEAERLDNS